MGVLKSLNDTSDKAIDQGEVYYKKTQEYFKLKVFQQLSLTIGILCKIVVIGSLLLLGIIFLCVAATMALAKVLDSPVLACSLVGLLLCLIGLTIYLFRSKIDTMVIKKIAKNFFG